MCAAGEHFINKLESQGDLTSHIKSAHADYQNLNVADTSIAQAQKMFYKHLWVVEWFRKVCLIHEWAAFILVGRKTKKREHLEH